MKGGGSIIVEASSQVMGLAHWKLCHLQQSQAKYMQSNTHLSKTAFMWVIVIMDYHYYYNISIV